MEEPYELRSLLRHRGQSLTAAIRRAHSCPEVVVTAQPESGADCHREEIRRSRAQWPHPNLGRSSGTPPSAPHASPYEQAITQCLWEEGYPTNGDDPIRGGA